MPPDQPDPAPPHLKVVSMLDRSGLAARLSATPGAVAPWFAPIVDLKRGEVAGYEALLSFEGEGPQPPRAWSQGVHGRHAGEVEAPLLAAALNARVGMPETAFLGISVSAQAVLSAEVNAVFEAAGRLDRVVVVVTDDTQGVDEFALRRALDTVRDAGATIALDETGSGYASLKQLLRLRPDFIRIGADFIGEVDRDHAKAAVVETLGSLASRIDSWVIAAGIAEPAELDALRRLQVPFGQGPLFGDPRPGMEPLDEVQARLIRDSAPPPLAGLTVAPLIESRPPIPWGAPIEDLADAFLEDPRHDVVVLVDDRRRPLALAERAALLRGEPYERPVMRITPSSPLKAVARRAAARPTMERFHPLVACDRDGVYLGIVRVEQMLDALAQ